jgi:hypothetical protein
MKTRLLMTLRVTVATPQSIGAVPYGTSRTVPITGFETAAPKYAFLNRLLAVGIAEAHREGPVHTIEEILGRRANRRGELLDTNVRPLRIHNS